LSSVNVTIGDGYKIMSQKKTITPGQLKALVESDKDMLLAACLSAFNEIPNKRLNRGAFPSTYALAAALDKYVSEKR